MHNCPKCKTDYLVASPSIDGASGYGGSSGSSGSTHIIYSGKKMELICVKCNVRFTVDQQFENNTLVKEKIEWVILKENVIPLSGSTDFWKRYEKFKILKDRKLKLEKLNNA